MAETDFNTILENMRKQFQRDLLCPPESLHKMLFSVRLKEYCDYLERLSIQTGIFRKTYEANLYAELLYDYYKITPERIRRSEMPDDSPPTELTLGKMLQKAADLACHPGDYLQPQARMLGCYIADTLMIRPFIMLKKAEQDEEFKNVIFDFRGQK